MKVGVNTLFLIPGEVGGSETYLLDILRHGVGRYPEVQWILFTNRENHELLQGEFGRGPNVTCRLIPVKARNRTARIIQEQVRLPLVAHRAGVDVLWSPGYTAPLWASCPQVVSVLDMQYREFPEDLSPAALLATRFLVPGAVRVARRVITLSGFSRDTIIRHTSCRAEKITPIHLAAGVEFGVVKPDGEARRRVLVPQAPYILCVAHTYPHKNVHALVEAFGRLRHEGECNLVLVGRERRGEPLVAEALRKLDRPDRVIRLQGLAREDLIALYQGAAVFAFPSLYEGFGLPVLEAMAAGAPVVTTGRGPMREIGGDTIRYCDGSADGLAGGISEVLAFRPEIRAEWIERARRRSGEFSWERTADLTMDVLRAASV